jgi:hypothetical protein
MKELTKEVGGTSHNEISLQPEDKIASEEVRLNVDEILIAEFEYVAQTIFQANEDRARVTSFHLITTGSLVAAILGSQVERLQDPQTYFGFAALFIVLSFSGVLTLLQLVRLRQAWFDSATTLNQIKEFYVQHTHEMNLKDAFRWRMTTIPPQYKPWSIAYLLAVQVGLLGGITIGAAVIFFGLGINILLWWYAIVIGVIFSISQIFLYQLLLSRYRPRNSNINSVT